LPVSRQYTNPYSIVHSGSPQVSLNHRILLSATSIIALAAGAALPTTPAIAVPTLDVCAAAAPGDTVTIGPDAGAYPAGIVCSVQDITLVLQGDSDAPAIINTTTNTGLSVPLSGLDGPVTLNAEAGSSIATSGVSLNGVQIGTAVGPVSINMAGDVATGGDYSVGILVTSDTGAVDVDVSGSVSTAGIESHAISTYASQGNTDITLLGSVETGGPGSQGIHALNHYGDVAVTVGEDANVSTLGEGALGIWGQSQYGNVTVNVDGTVDTAQTYSYGVVVLVSGENDATVNIGGAVTTTGENAHGVKLNGSDGLATANVSGAVITTGEGAGGVGAQVADGTASINVSGSIATSGAVATGASADAKYGHADIDVSGSVVTTGDYSSGVTATSKYAASVNVEGSISTSGVYAAGVYASSTHPGVLGEQTVSVTVNDVSTTGDTSHAISTWSETGDTQITVTGNVLTTGNYSHGIWARSSEGNISVDVSGSVSAIGEGAHGIAAESTGAVDITVDGTVIGGINGAGINLFTPSETHITINEGASVSAASGRAIDTGFTSDPQSDDTLDVLGAIVGDVFLHDGSSHVTFGATADLSGLGVFDAGDDNEVDDGFVDFLVFNGTTGTVYDTTFINFESITLDGAAITILHGDGTILGTSQGDNCGISLLHGSVLDLSAGTGVLGNINVDDTSRLVAGGTLAAPQVLQRSLRLSGELDLVNNAPTAYVNIARNLESTDGTLSVDAGIGAAGDPITGDMVVVDGDLTGTLTLQVNTVGEAGAQTDDPLLVVLGDASQGDVVLGQRVDHGIYVYGLEEDDQAWYLVNDHIFEQVSAYETITSVLGTQNVSSVGTLRQRVGAASVWDAGARMAQGVWFRGQYDDTKGDAGIGENAGAFNADRLFGQLGFDLFSHEGQNTTIIASVFGTLGSSDVDNRDEAGAATGGANINDYGVGLGLTVYHGGNFFLDAVFQALWQDVDFKSANGVTAQTDANSLMGSLEVGYNFDLNGGWHLSPEAQIIFGSLDLDDYVDSDAIIVTHGGSGGDKAKSVVGRLGMTLEHNDGGNFIGYVKLAISNEFEGEGEMVFNGQTVSWDYSGTGGEVQLGGSYKIGERSHIFGEFTYADKFSGQGLRNIGGKAGVKVGF
jgi:outer membrane autotransporter protein